MSRIRWGRGWMAAALVAMLAACGVHKGWNGPPPPADEDRLDWAADEPYFVVVRTWCRTLDVYVRGERVRSYPAVFGLGGPKGKLHEGDRKTPTGLYAIVDKREHDRWHQFLLLDYPNLQDVQRYWTALDSGRIPMLDNHYAGVGGAVGIHGTDRPRLNESNVDWTWGCISLANDDVDELAGMVPVGTPVLIED
ncbi:MAG TPA: L,D-transpeptidase [Candidatus Eisenbacteria bacterium]|nr:L,D-transpeptidase [Candidatus Eisenbacteria bacterium]